MGTDLPSTDFLIVGGGVIGLTLALALRNRYERARITVLEKEPACGGHASGRNSGVLHAGFYYAADSLKARFTRDGNRRLTEYCTARGIPVRRTGKLVVARNAAELVGLDELERRACVNGVPLERVSADEARRIEPLAVTYERALFSPTTSSVDPARVVAALVADLATAGIALRVGTAYRARTAGAVLTSGGPIAAGYVVNAAGLYADRIARDFGFAERYRILPFKGLYLRGGPGAPALRTQVYPVPDLRHPFLGVHFTVLADGHVKIGPTATPAFWREHYAGWRNFQLAECLEILAIEAGLFARDDFGFRRLAAKELRKYSRRHLLALAAELVPSVCPEQFPGWGPAGIRAQLYDVQRRTLVSDFHFEGDDRSFHVLNAVSPAFTCAFPFSAALADEITRLTA
jgi:L-2-hydroxyglutarate oxidase LhgO